MAEWVLASIDDSERDRLAASARCSPLVAALLLNRGVRDAECARDFLHPALSGLHPPETLVDLPAATAAIRRTLDARRTICIYGDYDVDGLTATALLCHLFRHLGAEVFPYIPDRLEEGYGVHVGAVERIAARGAGLIITVDSGAKDLPALRRARALGLEVVVTDHHPISGPPMEFPLLHPARPDAPAPFPELSGVGVAFKLVWGIGKNLSGGARVTDEFREFMLDALAFVAIGTIADVAPLRGENRVLVRYGLEALRRTRHPGLARLMTECRLDPARVDAEDVAFRLAPPMNAAGRLGRASDALDLLLCREPSRAGALAHALVAANRERKRIEQEMLAACEARLLESGDLERPGVLLLAAEGWHSGVAGIVAARLVERYRRPAFVIAIRDGIGRGSARSIPELPLEPIYAAVGPACVGLGGHSLAGGIVVEPDRIPELRARLDAAGVLPRIAPPATLRIDLPLRASEVTNGVSREIQTLAPFGAGNAVPRFLLEGLVLAGQPKLVGRGEEHLAFAVKADSVRPVRAIYFGGARWARPLADSRGPFALVAEIATNDYRGQAEAELRVVDVSPGGGAGAMRQEMSR